MIKYGVLLRTKVAKVMDQLHDGGIKASFLGVNECRDYADRFFAVNFRDDVFSMTDFKVDNEVSVWVTSL